MPEKYPDLHWLFPASTVLEVWGAWLFRQGDHSVSSKLGCGLLIISPEQQVYIRTVSGKVRYMVITFLTAGREESQKNTVPCFIFDQST